ncbi:MAG: type II secretion system F family protein [Eubacterium sp.]|nr:type II secretion system F family protein [Eubacterium sp.]
MNYLLPILAAGVIGYLFFKKKIKKKVFLLLLLLTGISAAVIRTESAVGPERKITQLAELREGQSAELEAETEDGSRIPVTITIPESRKSAEEIQEAFAAAIKWLDRVIPGENSSLDHVNRNLYLPDAAEDDPDLTISWTSSAPEILSYDGTIGSEIPQSGAGVTITGTLSLQDEEETYSRKVCVFPSKEEAVLAEKMQEESNALNAGNKDAVSGKEKSGTEKSGETAGESAEKGVYRLPESVDGQKVIWYQKTEQSGVLLCLLVLITALMIPRVEKKREEEKQRRRCEELQKEYPGFVSRIQLLLAAGLSLRRVFEKLTGDFRKAGKNNNGSSPISEEVARTWYELQSGVREQDAYMRFGERCGTRSYKELALLLSQNVSRGGQRLPELLENEAQTAFEDRKRHARAEGEKASIRLMLPMALMLIVVLVIIMVPAMMSF